MVRVFLAGKFGQSFFSTAVPLVKKSMPYIMQTANIATQALAVTKVTSYLANQSKVIGEEKEIGQLPSPRM
ncbi:hypothetical protein ACNVED_02900 [Legionella sp. D16C41]|uniref:hypothetical protein n=1 Tax=Legionella sp. D16C41 TaxID=3402688 RepID=UPI003AF628A7